MPSFLPTFRQCPFFIPILFLNYFAQFNALIAAAHQNHTPILPESSSPSFPSKFPLPSAENVLRLSMNGSAWGGRGEGPLSCEELERERPPTLDELSRIIYSILMPVICLLGSIGALICVFIFTRRQMRCSLSIYLGALSSFDFVLLVCAMIIYPSMNLCLQEGNHGPICHFFWRTSLATYPISLMAQTASVWTVVAITVDRYLAVKYPLHMRAWCTAHRARTVVFCITAVAILFKMPSFFEVALNECGHLTKTELRQDYLYFVIYYTYGYLLLMLAAPFLFIIILNAQVLSIIRKANLQRYEMRKIRSTRDTRWSGANGATTVGRGSGSSWTGGQQQKGEQYTQQNGQHHQSLRENGHQQPQQCIVASSTGAATTMTTTTTALPASASNTHYPQTNCSNFFSTALPHHDSGSSSAPNALDSRCTKMAIVTISAFVLFNWLAGINHVIEAFNLVRDDGQNMRIPIGNFLVCLNSATNILIYSLFGRRFRHQFCRVFCPCTRKYDQLNRSSCPNKTELI